MKKVLILCTDQFTIDQLNRDLSTSELELVLITDPNNFFDELRSFKPDLVVVDFILSEKNGGSICHQLKSNPDTKDYPVLMISEFAERPERFGCDRMIYKPFDTDALVAKIYQCLEEAKVS